MNRSDTKIINNDVFFSEGLHTAIFNKLMPYRVKSVLLVASLYDYFMLEEDGRFTQLLNESYKQWGHGYVPELFRAGTTDEALKVLKERNFDLVIVMVKSGTREAAEDLIAIRECSGDNPVVILAYNNFVLQKLFQSNEEFPHGSLFVWNGDGSILLSIIEYVEDVRNAESDTLLAGIQNLLIVEPSVESFSTYLPLVYHELKQHTGRLLHDYLTFTQRMIRQKARPRVHIAGSYEEAIALYEKYSNHLIGVISELSLPMGGEETPEAGRMLIRKIKKENPCMPVLVYSRHRNLAAISQELSVECISKKKSTHLNELSDYILNEFGFSDLLFCDMEGDVVQQVAHLSQLYSSLEYLDPTVVEKHLCNGSVTRWLRARTNFELADKIDSIDKEKVKGQNLNESIRDIITEFKKNTYRGSIVKYSRKFHEEHSIFSQLDGGSIGGKARGLAFIDRILSRYMPDDIFPGIRISIPGSLVIGTDVFDSFMKQNDLIAYALSETGDRHIANNFIKASLPPRVLGDLKDLVKNIRTPLAVRSSSLFEDSLYQPFAGVYATKMIPNDHNSDNERFNDLVNAIKFVFSSTYFNSAKSYIRNSTQSIENEKMAVLIQSVVGKRHGDLFYPDISGVARSYNYYPSGDGKADDGVINLALGLGKTIVNGEVYLYCSPARPEVLPQFSDIKDMMRYSQKEFYAISMNQSSTRSYSDEDQYLIKGDLLRAEKDGSLKYIASTYSGANDAVYDGIMASGPRIITFSHILKNNIIPFTEAIEYIMNLCSDAMGSPVEIEFAMNLNQSDPVSADLFILQVRPMITPGKSVSFSIDDYDEKEILCYSERVLGNGHVDDIYDILYISKNDFIPGKSLEIASEVNDINRKLVDEKRKYVLIGPGRWGTSEPWLGIPVNWNSINGAAAIVETDYPGRHVDPSQGSHFFHNIVSLGTGYFTMYEGKYQCRFDSEWLDAADLFFSGEYVRHIRLNSPLKVRINGASSTGIIFKPDY